MYNFFLSFCSACLCVRFYSVLRQNKSLITQFATAETAFRELNVPLGGIQLRRTNHCTTAVWCVTVRVSTRIKRLTTSPFETMTLLLESSFMHTAHTPLTEHGAAQIHDSITFHLILIMRYGYPIYKMAQKKSS